MGSVVGHSCISGVWEPVEGAPDTLVIRQDGTFDFSGTMLGIAGDTRRLRKAGDALEPEAGNRLEIVRSAFAPTLSYIRLKATRTYDDGHVESAYAQYDARLDGEQRLLVRAGVLPGSDSPRESVPAVVYRRVGDAPPERAGVPSRAASQYTKSASDDEYVAFGRRYFAGTNWFEKVHVRRVSDDALKSFLVTPRDAEQAQRFLVVTIVAHSENLVKDCLAASAVDAARAGCSILLIMVPELDTAATPEEERVAELAHRVLAETRVARDLLRARGTGLMTSMQGDYLGHFIWQRNNAPYGAWFCCDRFVFQWYGASADTDHEKPLLLGTHRFPTELEVEKRDAILARYRREGFRNARTFEFTGGKEADQEAIEALLKAASDTRPSKK